MKDRSAQIHRRRSDGGSVWLRGALLMESESGSTNKHHHGDDQQQCSQ
jgi:hypothetical protein